MVNSSGKTQADFAIFVKTNPEYFFFEIKYYNEINKNFLIKNQSEWSRIKNQYQVLTNLSITDWDGTSFYQEVGELNVIYIIIYKLSNSNIEELITSISFNSKKDSLISYQKQKTSLYAFGQKFISNHNTLNELNNYMIQPLDFIYIPFTITEFNFKESDSIYGFRLSRRQALLFLKLFSSFLFEKISTSKRKFTLNEIYEGIFIDVKDFFKFGIETEKNIQRKLHKFLLFVSDIKYQRDRKILSYDAKEYHIIPRNIKNFEKNLSIIRKKIYSLITTRRIEDFIT